MSGTNGTEACERRLAESSLVEMQKLSLVWAHGRVSRSCHEPD